MEYIRFVSRMTRWDGSMNISRPDAGVCGDAITDLKTTNNQLSIWLVEDKSQIKEVAAVIALGRQKLDRVCYIELDKNLIDNQLKIIKEMGECNPIEDESILARHHDIEELDSRLLEKLSLHMLDQVQKKQKGDYDIATITDIIFDMMEDNKIDGAKIPQKLMQELQKQREKNLKQ